MSKPSTLGTPMICPPIDSQFPVVAEKCQSAPSVPRTKASGDPLPIQTAFGLDPSFPPAGCHPLTLDQYHSAMSVPRTKTTSSFTPLLTRTADGADDKRPPSAPTQPPP